MNDCLCPFLCEIQCDELIPTWADETAAGDVGDPNDLPDPEEANANNDLFRSTDMS
jgi:hypothetical protein